MLSGTSLAWYDSEANALAPGGGSKPLGTLGLTKACEIEPVDGEKAAAIIASGKEAAGGSSNSSAGAASGPGLSRLNSTASMAGWASPERPYGGGGGSKDDGEGGFSATAAKVEPTHVLTVTSDGKLVLTAAAGSEGDREAWVTLMRCASDPDRYPLPPRPPISITRPQPRTISHRLTKGGSSAPLLAGSSNYALAASPSASLSASPATPAASPGGDESPSALNVSGISNSSSVASVNGNPFGNSALLSPNYESGGGSSASSSAGDGRPALSDGFTRRSSSRSVEAEISAGAAAHPQQSNHDDGSPAAAAVAGSSGGRLSPASALAAVAAQAESFADRMQADVDRLTSLQAELDAKEFQKQAQVEEEERAKAAAEAARQAEIDRIRAEERQKLMRELGLTPNADIAALVRDAPPPPPPPPPVAAAATASAPGTPPQRNLSDEQLNMLPPASRALAERLAAVEAELAKERAVSALRSKQYEMDSTYARENAARMARERDQSRMRQREVEIELERQQLIAKQAAMELELERKRSKLNYTVNVVKTIEVDRGVGPHAAAAGGEVDVDVTAAMSHATGRPPLPRAPSAYEMKAAGGNPPSASASSSSEHLHDITSSPPSLAGLDRRSMRRASLLGRQVLQSQQPPPPQAQQQELQQAHEEAQPAATSQESVEQAQHHQQQQHNETAPHMDEGSPSPSDQPQQTPSDSDAASTSQQQEPGQDTLRVQAEQPVAPTPAWECGPLEGERGIMRKRIGDYLLRRTPSASSSPAQAAYLTDVVVPSVEDALYRDAAGES